VARGLAGEASPGLGKLSGGDYDGLELIRARVELASGVRWFHPGELDRVYPHVEAALVRHALDAGLLPAASVARLQRSLDAFWEGRQEFYRTPGLLDALWFLHQGPQPTDLAGLFEASREALLRIAPQLAPPRPLQPPQPRFHEAREHEGEPWQGARPIAELEEDEEWVDEWEGIEPLGQLATRRSRADYQFEFEDDDDI